MKNDATDFTIVTDFTIYVHICSRGPRARFFSNQFYGRPEKKSKLHHWICSMFQLNAFPGNTNTPWVPNGRMRPLVFHGDLRRTQIPDAKPVCVAQLTVRWDRTKSYGPNPPIQRVIGTVPMRRTFERTHPSARCSNQGSTQSVSSLADAMVERTYDARSTTLNVSIAHCERSQVGQFTDANARGTILVHAALPKWVLSHFVYIFISRTYEVLLYYKCSTYLLFSFKNIIVKYKNVIENIEKIPF